MSTQGSSQKLLLVNTDPCLLSNEKINHLKPALFIAIACIALVAIVFAEVKLGFLRAGAAYLLGNPLLLSVICLAAFIAIGYLTYQKKNSSMMITVMEEIPRRDPIPNPILRIEFTIASQEELTEAFENDSQLEDDFALEFPNVSSAGESEESARQRVHDRLQELNTNAEEAKAIYQQIKDQTQRDPFNEDRVGSIELLVALATKASADAAAGEFPTRAPLILRWLMTAE